MNPQLVVETTLTSLTGCSLLTVNDIKIVYPMNMGAGAAKVVLDFSLGAENGPIE